MLISQLDLRNFRRFERVTVELSPLTVITGANGVGKSTLIDAMRFVLEATDGRDRPWDFYTSVHAGSLEERQTIEVRLRLSDLSDTERLAWGTAVWRDGSVRLGAQASPMRTESGRGEIIEGEVWGHSGPMVIIEGSPEGMFPRVERDRESWVLLEDFAESTPACRQALPTLVTIGGPDRRPPVVGDILGPLLHQAVQRRLGTRLDEILGPLAESIDEVIESADATLGESLPRYLPVASGGLTGAPMAIELLHGVVDAWAKRLAVRLDYGDGRISIIEWAGSDDPENTASGGTNRTAVLSLLELYRNPDLWPTGSAVILAIEEPEIGLDAAAQRRLGRALRQLPSFGVQSVVVSHSPVIADAAGWDGVRLVVPDGHLSSTVAHQPDASDVAAALGVTPTDALLGRRFLLVEGASDAIALEAWSVALGSSLSASGIRTHPVGGLSMATAVAELTRLVFSGAAITVVLDQGPGSQTEAMELQARFGQQVNVVVLARSQLEAYFSVAAVGRWLSINGASEDDVADTLERLRPTGVTKKALQGLTKRLLGREYRVAEDGGAIAGLMREAEISPEMKGLLLEIIG